MGGDLDLPFAHPFLSTSFRVADRPGVCAAWLHRMEADPPIRGWVLVSRSFLRTNLPLIVLAPWSKPDGRCGLGRR